MDINPKDYACPYCHSKDVGLWNRKLGRLRCRNCRRTFTVYSSSEDYLPRVLILDIETLPMEVLVWGLYKQKILPQNIIKEWCIVSWAAKWLSESTIFSDVLRPDEATARNDNRIIDSLWHMLEEASIVVAHNGARFDVRKINARFIANGYKPPSPYQVIDTMIHAKRNMAFSSYSLAYLAELLGLSEKMKTSYQLWRTCAGVGNPDSEKQYQALADMVAYNRQDIRVLEDLYIELRPWIKSHPNIGLFYSESNVQRCPNCGGTSLDFNVNMYYTPAGRFRSFRCLHCGAIGRSRISDLSKKERASLTVPTAR